MKKYKNRNIISQKEYTTISKIINKKVKNGFINALKY